MKPDTIKITEQEKEMFNYLNDLRDSGVVNMFGAIQYFLDEFNIDSVEARVVLLKWIENFNEDGYDHLT